MICAAILHISAHRICPHIHPTRRTHMHDDSFSTYVSRNGSMPYGKCIYVIHIAQYEYYSFSRFYGLYKYLYTYFYRHHGPISCAIALCYVGFWVVRQRWYDICQQQRTRMRFWRSSYEIYSFCISREAGIFQQIYPNVGWVGSKLAVLQEQICEHSLSSLLTSYTRMYIYTQSLSLQSFIQKLRVDVKYTSHSHIHTSYLSYEHIYTNTHTPILLHPTSHIPVRLLL